jgi:ABC-type nitrate/sulfonate/bicarbonate transport system substrate-binding protein
MVTTILRLLALVGIAALAVFGFGARAQQDTIKYGSAIKLSPVYYLPILAAQERGIFKKHGLNVEWIPSESGPDFQRNIAGSIVQIGSSTAGNDIPAISRGVQAQIVASLQPTDGFAIWVLSNSRFKAPQDLKGARLGVSRLSGLEHAYGLVAAKKLGLTNDIRFIGTGGVRESLAVLVTGSIDGVILNPQNLIELKLQGRVRELLPIAGYLPKPWLFYTITASRSLVEKRPETVERIVKSIIEANQFVMSPTGKPWALAKMKEMNKYSDQGAEVVYSTLNLSQDGKIDTQGLHNLVGFMTEYGLMKSGEVGRIDTLFTDRFVR